MKKYLKIFFERIDNMNFGTMKSMIDEIHKESGVPKAIIISDMLWSASKYGVGYVEYRLFGWVYIKGKKRNTFMVMKNSLEIYEKLNQKEYLHIFENKIEFLERFSEYTGREFLNIEKAQCNDFVAFCKKHNSIMVKPVDGSGGIGVRKVTDLEYLSDDDIKKTYEYLKNKKLFLIEECLAQREDVKKLAPNSINTLRMVTVLGKDGEAHLIYTVIRIGDGVKAVDNTANGGIYAPVDENGMIFAPAFSHKTGKLYDFHPRTGEKIKGLKIEGFSECIELVKRASKEVPQIRYVGWDVAVTPDKPVLIEGNTFPSYALAQVYYHLPDGKNGILKKIEDLI